MTYIEVCLVHVLAIPAFRFQREINNAVSLIDLTWSFVHTCDFAPGWATRLKFIKNDVSFEKAFLCFFNDCVADLLWLNDCVTKHVLEISHALRLGLTILSGCRIWCCCLLAAVSIALLLGRGIFTIFSCLLSWLICRWLLISWSISRGGFSFGLLACFVVACPISLLSSSFAISRWVTRRSSGRLLRLRSFSLHSCLSIEL